MIDAKAVAVVERYFAGENLKEAIAEEKAELAVEKIHKIVTQAKKAKEDSENGKRRV